MPSTRIFIGNLTVDIEENDIKQRFSSYGIINKIDIKNKLDIEGNPVSRFAYLNLEAEQTNLNECMQNTNGSKLKGSILKVEIAKESFLDRLRREREQTHQSRDIISYKAKNNEVSSNYNFENTDQTKFNKKENNFNNSSHSYGSLNSYDDKFDNFNSNFENLNDGYESLENNSTHNDNSNKRSYGLQDDENDPYTFPSFKRYYPETSEKSDNLKKDDKLTENSNTEKPQKGFVNIHSKLDFNVEGSSFSLLKKFSAVEAVKNEVNEEININKKAFKSSNNIVDEKKISVPKVKSRNFFISADDPMLEGAADWILTPLTEENQKEFDEIRDSLLGVSKLRDSRAKRDSHLRGRRPKFARINR